MTNYGWRQIKEADEFFREIKRQLKLDTVYTTKIEKVEIKQMDSRLRLINVTLFHNGKKVSFGTKSKTIFCRELRNLIQMFFNCNTLIEGGEFWRG